jgi:glycosyltransferase involved in cell wall biosynthesis
MAMSKISVVMSVYNGEKYLSQAVESILNQTYQDFEFVIINDGSADGSFDILRNFETKDKRIRLISRENKGLIYSLNEGVKIAQGEYIARMDADDISTPERLEKQLKYASENDLAVCGTWAEGVDSFGNKVKDLNYPPNMDEVKKYTLLHNPFIHPSVMFKKDPFEKVGGYKDFFKHVEDYELWTRIVFKYKTGNLPERLLQYRLHEGQITNKNNLRMRLKGILVRILALSRFIFRF